MLGVVEFSRERVAVLASDEIRFGFFGVFFLLTAEQFFVVVLGFFCVYGFFGVFFFWGGVILDAWTEADCNVKLCLVGRSDLEFWGERVAYNC